MLERRVVRVYAPFPHSLYFNDKGRARGLDSDKWFNNVEIVIAGQIGTETTTSVRNVYKYHVAYRLMLDAQAEAEKTRLQGAPMKG